MYRGLLPILGPNILDDLISIISTYAHFEGIEVDILKGHIRGVTGLAVLPDETGVSKAHPNVASVAGRLASGAFDGRILIWDLTTRSIQALQNQTDYISCLTVLPDGRLASESYDSKIRIWDLSTRTSQFLEGHTGSVTSLVVLPKEPGMDFVDPNVASVTGRLASGSRDKTIRIWDLSTGMSQVLEGHTDQVTCLAVLPDATGMGFDHPNDASVAGRLASGSFDGTIRVWDVSTRTSQVLGEHAKPNSSRRFKRLTMPVTSLAVLPDGRLASGSRDKTIRIWDLSTGMSQVLEGHTNQVTSLAVLPDGRLASGSYDKTIRIWDLFNGTNQVLKGHTKEVSCLAVFPDGRLASGSYDDTIRIWV